MHSQKRRMKQAVCQHCGKAYQTRASAYYEQTGRAKYCSRSCMAAAKHANAIRAVICAHCGKTFETSRSDNPRYCSRSCATSARIGPRNGNWKGGISFDHYHYRLLQKQRYPQRVRAREIAYQAIRSGKLRRLPCEICGAEKTVAHHDDYSHPLSVRWLCSEHHPRSSGNRKK